MRSRATFVLMAVGLIFVVGCDELVSYSVINRTSEPVNSVFFDDPCADWMRDAEVEAGIDIPPGAKHSFDGVTPAEPECVLIRSGQVKDLSRYVSGTTYIVEYSSQGGAPEVVSFHDEGLGTVADPAHGEKKRNRTLIAIGILAASLAIPGAAILGLVKGVGYARRRWRKAGNQE